MIPIQVSAFYRLPPLAQGLARGLRVPVTQPLFCCARKRS